MKHNSEHDVYFLGENRNNSKKKKVWLCVSIMSAIILTAVVLILSPTAKKNHVTDNTQQQELQTIDVLPENAKAPLFMEKYPIEEFLSWMAKEITYPQGEELKDAKVVVSFVITAEGRLDSIAIVSQPAEKSFGRQVIKTLKKCPKWTPGKLANGEPANIRYTLPVRFEKERKFN